MVWLRVVVPDSYIHFRFCNVELCQPRGASVASLWLYCSIKGPLGVWILLTSNNNSPGVVRHFQIIDNKHVDQLQAYKTIKQMVNLLHTII